MHNADGSSSLYFIEEICILLLYWLFSVYGGLLEHYLKILMWPETLYEVYFH